MKKRHITVIGSLLFIALCGMEEVAQESSGLFDYDEGELSKGWVVQQKTVQQTINIWQKICSEDGAEEQKKFFAFFCDVFGKALAIDTADKITPALYQLVNGPAQCRGIAIFRSKGVLWGYGAREYQFGTSLTPGHTPTLYIGAMQKAMSARDFESLKKQFVEAYKKAAPKGDQVPIICYKKESLFALAQNDKTVNFKIQS